MKLRSKLAIAVIGLLGASVWWLFYDNRPVAEMAPLDIAALRAAASAVPGEKAASISVERSASGALPAAFLVAGAGFGEQPQGVHAFRVEIPGGPVVIDTGMDANSAKEMGVYALDKAAQDRVFAALAEASAIIITHEHMDHLGGIITSPDWVKVGPKSLVTRQQFDNISSTLPLTWPADRRAGFKPLDYQGVKAIAPGVAVMKAPSHTKGSQIAFVQLSDGREYLFMGDISSMDRNWRETRARSRLVGDWIVGEDRAAVFRWLNAFKASSRANPALIMVPTHDAEAVDRMIGAGQMTRGFVSAKP